MKVLICDSGIDSSTGDVFRGYCAAFERAGHIVIRYQLSARIDQANYMLHRAWVQKGRDVNRRPTQADVYYRASEGVLSFALRSQPDLVLTITSQFLHPDILVFLERAGFNVGIIGTESPYGDSFTGHYMQAVDVGWTNERTSVNRLCQIADTPHVHYLPAAYDPTIHYPEPELIDQDLPAHDVVLVATAFKERIDLLSAVDWTGIDLGLYGDWGTLPSRSKLRQYVRKFIIPNRTTASLYRRAKIGLNLYRDGLILAGKPGDFLTYVGAESVPAESLNPRAYELAACECFQISQYRAEVFEIFRDTVPTFTTPSELEEAIRFALAYPQWRQKSAAAARICIYHQTFDSRVRQILRQVADVPTIVPQRVGLADRSRLHAV